MQFCTNTKIVLLIGTELDAFPDINATVNFVNFDCFYAIVFADNRCKLYLNKFSRLNVD